MFIQIIANAKINGAEDAYNTMLITEIYPVVKRACEAIKNVNSCLGKKQKSKHDTKSAIYQQKIPITTIRIYGAAWAENNPEDISFRHYRELGLPALINKHLLHRFPRID